MSRIVPFDSNYTTVRKFEKTAFYCLLFSAIAIIYLWLILKVEPLISFKISSATTIDLVKVLSYELCNFFSVKLSSHGYFFLFHSV